MANATLVSYGAGTRWIAKMVTGTGTCSNAFFGTDPAPNVVKSCVADTGTTATPPGVTLAAEGGTFTVPTATVVSYGADTRWVQQTVIGTVSCTNAFFGTDPAPGTVKSCVAPAGTLTGTRLAVEGGTFTVATATVVSYGADTRWVQQTVTGTASCTNAFFGTDPAPGTVKSCVAAS
jgi:hypothetical protein